MAFHIIDMAAWPRREYFDYYIHKTPCSYNVCVNLDISRLLKSVRSKGLSLYPVLIYIVASAVNQNCTAFRFSFDQNGHLGYYDVLSPAYTVFHEDDKTFSNLWTIYHNQFSVFYKDYQNDQMLYRDRKGLFPKETDSPLFSHLLRSLDTVFCL